MEGFVHGAVTIERSEAETNGAANDTHDDGGALFMKRLLCVCIENSNRTRMAEACGRMRGAGWVHDVRACR